MALTTNLTNYYKLDGDSTDSVGSANGTDTAITYSSGNGKINQGAGSNGTTSVINLGTTIPLSGSADFSLFCWVKTSTTGTRQALITIGNSNNSANQRVFLFINSSNHAACDLNQSAGPSGAVNVCDGNWHYVGVVVTSSVFQIWVDGSTDGSSQSKSPNITGTQFLLAQDATSGGNCLNGAMDEVGIWTRALSSSEISSLYHSGSGFQYPFVNSATLSEAITVTDTFIRSIVRTLSESITNSDTLSTIRVKIGNLTEAISVTDAAITRAVTKVLTDAATVTDTIARSIVRALSEAVTATDSLIRTITHALIESITLTDTIKKLINGSDVIWAHVNKSTAAVWTHISKSADAAWTHITRS